MFKNGDDGEYQKEETVSNINETDEAKVEEEMKEILKMIDDKILNA